MKGAREVIDLMGAYPGRVFVMRELVRYCNPEANRLQKLAWQRSIHRVLVILEVQGVVQIERSGLGGQNRYAWKT